MSERQENNQNDGDIAEINPREHVRKRPGMYIGGIDQRAMHHLIYEVVDSSIELAFAGECNHVWITLRNNNEVCIRDNGAEISTDIDQATGRPILEVIMTNIGMSNQRVSGVQKYRIAAGLHGLGFSVVNALSERLSIEATYKGYLWKQDYKEGIPQTKVTQVRELETDESRGIAITFRTDSTIFEPSEFDYEKLYKRCRELSYLVEGLTLTLRDERHDPAVEEHFYTRNGLIDLVKTLNQDKLTLHETIVDRCKVIITQEQGIDYAVFVDFAFQFTDTMDFSVKSYVNTVETPDGGSHILALRSAIASAINYNRFDEFESNNIEYSPFEVSRGLTAVIHVMHPMPSFQSPTKVKLLVPAELYGAVSEAVFRACNNMLKDSKVEDKIVEKCEANRRILSSR